jgi:hypothetical protein
MSKVIVERPRLRFPLRNGSAYPRGHLENRWAPDFENAPRIESMGGTYREKWLNENLQPLVRFLRSHVGRRWDDVYSEIAARISCRSAVLPPVSQGPNFIRITGARGRSSGASASPACPREVSGSEAPYGDDAR